MEASQRLKLALSRCKLSSREIAREMTLRGIETSHSTVNRWAKGFMPRLDEAALLAEVAELDLMWLLYGEGPAPWELTEGDRRLLWLAGLVGYEEAAARLAAAEDSPDRERRDPDPPPATGPGTFSTPQPSGPRLRSRKGPA